MADEEKSEPDYVARMRTELDELTGRTERLGAFIAGDTFQELDREKRALMTDQHIGMEQYREALAQRLDLETAGADGDRPAAA